MAALGKQVALIANVPLVVEYEATCSLVEHRLAAGLNKSEVGQFLDAVVAMVEPVETHFLWRPMLRDPSDEMVLEAAVNGHAAAIVTFNVRDYGLVPREFGVEIWQPREALRRVLR